MDPCHISMAFLEILGPAVVLWGGTEVLSPRFFLRALAAQSAGM